MAGGVDQAEQRSGRDTTAALLTQAESVSESILAAARDEAASVLAGARRDAERLVGVAARQADAVRSAAASRAESLRARAAEDADAEVTSTSRRSREALLSARREGERLRDGAHDHADQVGAAADRRADDLLASARARAGELQVAARAEAEDLMRRTEAEVAARLTEARQRLEQASAARTAAMEDAESLRCEAARTATDLVQGATEDLEMARRVRSFARRDASRVVGAAMADAARSLHLAAVEFDAANDLLAEEERRPRHGRDPSPSLASVAVADPVPAAPPIDPEPEPAGPALELVSAVPEVPEWVDRPPAVQAPTVTALLDDDLPAIAWPEFELEPGDEALPAITWSDVDVDVPVEIPKVATGEAPVIPLLVPVLSFGRELVLRLMVLAATATTAWFWLWWLATGHGEWTFGSRTATALLAWVFGLSAYFFFFVCRMSRPNPALPVPDLRVAMVVTKAPAEAWPVLVGTLEAMLAQDYGRPYDVWLADERPTLETLQWCLEHGVKVSTRYGVEEYHRPAWPRRTKSKEGNLSWFYDQVAYDRYDVVVQLDADHVPAPSYLGAMVRPFADPAVGYVSAPSICDANAQEGWTVRGRLYREAAMHGPVQAGCNGGYAPVCIGSHYAVRTAALRDIGGIGPELAEDYSTTLWFQSAGWDGVFNIDAVAHGDGPATVEEMLVQEVQWARSLGTILMRWAPGRLRTVPWRARPRLAFALIYYPVSGLVVAMAAAAPVVGVLLRTSWGNTSLASFYIHLWPHTIVSMAIVVFLRRCLVLRPVDGKVWSWELILFQLVRWPWTLWGFLQGSYAGLRSKVVNFGVTPKSVPGARALPPRYLGPTLALGAIPAWIVVLTADPGPAVGLLILAAIQALVYLACACLVVTLHLTGNRRRRRTAPLPPSAPGLSPWLAGRAALLVTAGIVGPTTLALAWRLSTL